MKRFNLSFFNTNSEREVADAVLRVTYTAPQNFIGNLRASRFKITKGAFPLFYLTPDTQLFTQMQKEEIDRNGLTPTAFIWGFLFSDTDRFPCTKDTYLLSDDAPIPCSNFTGNFTPIHIVYKHVYLNQKPSWVPVERQWKLVNQPSPVYSWSDLTQNNASFSIFSYSDSPAYQLTSITSTDKGVFFNLVFKDFSAHRVTTGTCFLSSKAISYIKSTLDEEQGSFTLNSSVVRSINDPWLTDTRDLYVLDGKITFSKQVEGLLSGSRAQLTPFDLSLSVFYDYNLATGTLLLPYTAIILVIDELNFTGDNIVVNNPNLNGVINPSILSIFKTYIVGMDDPSRSDYIVIDDSITQAPLWVNKPNLNTLTVRLFMLTKDNNLIQMKIPSNEGFFLQLTLSN